MELGFWKRSRAPTSLASNDFPGFHFLTPPTQSHCRDMNNGTLMRTRQKTEYAPLLSETLGTHPPLTGPFPTTAEKGFLSQKSPISTEGTVGKMGNGFFSTPKPSPPDFGDFDLSWGVSPPTSTIILPPVLFFPFVPWFWSPPLHNKQAKSWQFRRNQGHVELA